MRILYQITLTTCVIILFILSSCTENSRKATDTGKVFLKSLYTCDFKACDALCTENGKEAVRWFASNLTEYDLPLISCEVEIETEKYEVTDSSAYVVFTAKNVIVCDSLETKGHIGNRTLKIELKNIKNSWKVDKLEW